MAEFNEPAVTGDFLYTTPQDNCFSLTVNDKKYYLRNKPYGKTPFVYDSHIENGAIFTGDIQERDLVNFISAHNAGNKPTINFDPMTRENSKRLQSLIDLCNFLYSNRQIGVMLAGTIFTGVKETEKLDRLKQYAELLNA